MKQDPMSSPDYEIEVDVAQVKAEGQAKAAPPRIREARFEDYPQISALEARYGLQPKTCEEWKHLWVQNPSYYDFRHWPIGWVCEDEEGKIVGSVCNIPLAYEFGKRRLVTATSRALVLETRYRPYAFTLLSQFFRQNNVDLFLNTSVNDRALKLQHLFRALRVPTGNWERSAFWITNYQGFTASLLARKEITGGQVLNYPLSVGLFVRDKLAGRDLPVKSREGEAEFCSQFDSRFDAFWQSIRKSCAGCLLADRSRDVLDWHYKHALKNEQAWVLTVTDHSGLSAFAIFCREDKPSLQLKRLRLVDFQSHSGKMELLRPILFRALERCQSEGIHMLEAFGFAPQKQQVLDSMNPHYRELSSWRYFYKVREPHLAATLSDPQVWDPSCFDGDSSL
jgi:hypothetical protein